MAEEMDKDEIEDKARELNDKARDKAHEISEQAHDYAGTARDQANGMRERTASGVGSTATQMREKVASLGGVGKDAGEKVAHGMESAAEYLHEHKSQDILADAKRFAREHPMKTVVGAILLAFLFGKITR